MRTNDQTFFDGENLKDGAILRALYNAAILYDDDIFYKAILEVKEVCEAIARAIALFCKAEYEKAPEKGFQTEKQGGVDT